MMSRLFPFVFILIAIAVFFGYVKPTWQTDVADVKAEIVTFDNALKAAKDFNTQLTRLQNEQNQIPVEQLERLKAFLPDGVDNIQLILDLTELATRSNIEITNFDTPDTGEAAQSGTEEIGSTSAVESLTITLSAEGSYDDFRTFLAGIERSLRPLDATAISIAQSETGVYTYEVTLRFYWLR